MTLPDPQLFASAAAAKQSHGYSRLFDERLLIDGVRADAQIQDRVLGAFLTGTMEGAAALELTLWDGDLELLRSGIFSRPGKPTGKAAKTDAFDRAAWARFGESQVILDGAFFRLAGASLNYGGDQRTITVTFEDRIASLMRKVRSHIKASRANETRSEFLHWMARRSWIEGVSSFGYFSPEEGQRQKIRQPDKTVTRSFQKGLSLKDKLTVKGNPADRAQLDVAEIILTEADSLKAPELAVLAAFCAAIGESLLIKGVPNSTGSGYAGVFQANPANIAPGDTKQQAHYFFTGGKGFQAGGAIALARNQPDLGPGDIATKVEASGQPGAFYGQWKAEAQAFLDAWGGVSTVTVSTARYQYEAGIKITGQKARENYWAGSKRLADEVRWRRFAIENILWFVTDDWLFGRQPVFILDDGPDTDGLISLSADADVGIPVAQILASAHTARWSGHPGGLVRVKDLGPLTGDWLTWEDRHDLLRETSDMTLQRPAPALAEPASKRRARTSTETQPDTGSPRDRIVKAAEKAHKQLSRYVYSQQRPMVKTLFPSADQTPTIALIGIDCSAFVTLCYKAAAVPDPNGRGYDRQGYTGTLAANGQRTSDPQPGDLVFYGDPANVNSHVGLYAGDGMVIEMGGTPGPLKLKVHYRSDFTMYRTYDLGTA